MYNLVKGRETVVARRIWGEEARSRLSRLPSRSPPGSFPSFRDAPGSSATGSSPPVYFFSASRLVGLERFDIPACARAVTAGQVAAGRRARPGGAWAERRSSERWRRDRRRGSSRDQPGCRKRRSARERSEPAQPEATKASGSRSQNAKSPPPRDPARRNLSRPKLLPFAEHGHKVSESLPRCPPAHRAWPMRRTGYSSATITTSANGLVLPWRPRSAHSDRLLCLTPFRAPITLGKTRLTMVGQTEIRILSQADRRDPDARPRLRSRSDSPIAGVLAQCRLRRQDAQIGDRAKQQHRPGTDQSPGIRPKQHRRFPAASSIALKGRPPLTLDKQTEKLTSSIVAIIRDECPDPAGCCGHPADMGGRGWAELRRGRDQRAVPACISPRWPCASGYGAGQRGRPTWNQEPGHRRNRGARRPVALDARAHAER